MSFQLVFELVLIIAAIMFLRWLCHKWFSKDEKKRSDRLVAKKVELTKLRQRKEDLEETVDVTEEVAKLQKEISQKEKALGKLERAK